MAKLTNQITNPLGVILLPGFQKRGMQVLKHINELREDGNDYLIPTEISVFADGARKAEVEETIRGRDIFVLNDITNYRIPYKMYGQENRMSPYDHFQDIKNVLSASAPSGAARRSVVMPFLVDGRQHRRQGCESLSCAHSLQELVNLGVENIVTVDAHDPNMQNAIPSTCFTNITPSVDLLQAYLKDRAGKIDRRKLVVISPDMGAMKRAGTYAELLQASVGTFYKDRDTSKVIDGKNPIKTHTFIGDSEILRGGDALIVDDMISGGDSVLDTARLAREKGAKSISAVVAFGLFNEGFEKFEKAHTNGIFDKVYCTNLSTLPQEEQQKNSGWLSVVDTTKRLAHVIDALNKNESVSQYIRGDEESLKKVLDEVFF